MTTPIFLQACTVLKGVGAKVAERLSKCHIHTVQDLLFHLPFRYQDRTRIVPMGHLRSGDQAVIEGTIESTDIIRQRKPVLVCRLSDGTGLVTLRFFHFTMAQYEGLSAGKQLRCFGEVRGWGRELEMIHPEYQSVRQAYANPVEQSLTPIYPTTEGLQQRSLRTLTEQALQHLEHGGLAEYLPETVRQQFHLSELLPALRYVHRPPPDARIDLLEAGVHPAQQRLAFEELLAHHLSLRRLRVGVKQYQSPIFASAGVLQQRFLSDLPFTLTAAQQRVAQEIAMDLTKEAPMLRLVQGDVGSGKTVVAALAVLQAVESGYQAAFMAPTELLAEQHFRNFRQWFEPLGIAVQWLAGKLSGKARQAMLSAAADGSAHVVVGTHALFQKDVDYHRLGLVIIDEQHRFGVHQRLALREKGVRDDKHPHQLIMTATPIPRTLAMTAYADLDHSIIDALPPGRTPVKTVVISSDRRAEVIKRIQHACDEGRQSYWVCTLIEESEVLECQAAEVTAQQLAAALPSVRIGLVHGRMRLSDKDHIMAAFKAGEVDLLVATTVIEVGVDVPNASLMVIENPERLGLAQLHQLRGRVGRGAIASFCVLLYQQPLSLLAKSRLAIIRDSHDGFEIAQRDLELRGPGDVLGTRQTGELQFRIANLLRDQALLTQVQQVADIMLRDRSDHIEPLINRWVGHSKAYGSV